MKCTRVEGSTWDPCTDWPMLGRARINRWEEWRPTPQHVLAGRKREGSELLSSPEKKSGEEENSREKGKPFSRKGDGEDGKDT